MNRQFTVYFGRLTVSAMMALGVVACGAARTESDGADDAERGGGGAVTIWTDSVELFFEYPPMVADQPGEPWAIHLTALRTFRPVTQGSLTLRFSGPDGGGEGLRWRNLFTLLITSCRIHYQTIPMRCWRLGTS